MITTFSNWIRKFRPQIRDNKPQRRRDPQRALKDALPKDLCDLSFLCASVEHKSRPAHELRISGLNLRALALAFSAPLLPLHADEPSGTWNIRVAAVDIIPGHDTLWLRTGPGAKPVPVSLNIRTFSQPVRYKGAANAVFFRSEAEATLAKPPAPMASAILSAKSSLIVFSPRPDGTSYQTMVIVDSDFPFGSFRFVNGSGIMAFAEIDGKRIRLKQGAAETVAFQETRNALPVRIMTVTDGKSPRLVRQSSWSIDMSQRELVFLAPGSAPGLVRLLHFLDSKTE